MVNSRKTFKMDNIKNQITRDEKINFIYDILLLQESMLQGKDSNDCRLARKYLTEIT